MFDDDTALLHCCTAALRHCCPFWHAPLPMLTLCVPGCALRIHGPACTTAGEPACNASQDRIASTCKTLPRCHRLFTTLKVSPFGSVTVCEDSKSTKKASRPAISKLKFILYCSYMCACAYTRGCACVRACVCVCVRVCVLSIDICLLS